MNLSTKISKIALNYVAPEDFYQYSIDEFFLDLTSSLHLFGNTPREVAKIIQKEIYNQTGINSTTGIELNMLLAKISMDIEAKHTPTGIAEWRYEDVPNKLWKISELTDMWGINVKTAKKLNECGSFTVGNLANYPHVYLKRDFGFIGTDLHRHANGIDESIVSHKHKTNKQGLGKSKILLGDYQLSEIKHVLVEHVEDTFYRTWLQKKYPTTISITLGYAD